MALTPAQTAMPLEGLDWRTPARPWRPLRAGQGRPDGGLGIPHANPAVPWSALLDEAGPLPEDPGDLRALARLLIGPG